MLPVRSGHRQIHLSTVHEIIHNRSRITKTESGSDLILPFINCKYRVHVRVVDHYPFSLKNFAHSWAEENFAPDIAPNCRELFKDKFEWGFSLYVEDATAAAGTEPERIVLTFDNSRAQNLLKMDAVE